MIKCNIIYGMCFSGGVNMVVYGTGLDVVKAPVMLITRVYKDEIKKFRTVCCLILLYKGILHYPSFVRAVVPRFCISLLFLLL